MPEKFRVAQVAQRVYGALSGDAQIKSLSTGVYTMVAPPTASGAYLVIDVPYANDAWAFNNENFMSSPTVSVAAVGKGVGIGGVTPLIERAAEVMKSLDLQAVDGTVVGKFVRTGHRMHTELEESVEWTFLALDYRTCAYGE